MKETTRYGVIKAVLDNRMTNQQAADSLGISKRQVQRIKKRVKFLGPHGVIHGNTGKTPTHAFTPEFKQLVIDRIKQHYRNFNYSHMSQFLAHQENIFVNRTTLREWLRPLGIGRKVRRQPVHRKRRPRSPGEGEILFLDGSPHLWFGDKPSTLILSTDDATGKPLFGIFQPHEDLDGCFTVCEEVFRRYGLPASFYLDRASHFTTTRTKDHDHKPTQFQRAMHELGIGLIFAHSPQARGRAERMNGSFQNRLVAELEFVKIDDPCAATQYLNTVFIPDYQTRFGVQPGNPTPTWRPLPNNTDIRNILCPRFYRTVTNDNTVSVKGQIIQLLPTASRRHFVRARVAVNHWLDDTWHIFHQVYKEIPCLPLPCHKPETTKLRVPNTDRVVARPVEKTIDISTGEQRESTTRIYNP
jgi:transposase